MLNFFRSAKTTRNEILEGNRPARTVVGAAFASDIVNAQTAPVQANVVEALGLGHLAKVV